MSSKVFIIAEAGVNHNGSVEIAKKLIDVAMDARKSIVAKVAIKKGETLTEENITIKRPSNGINPMRWDEIVGSAALRDYSEDELI